MSVKLTGQEGSRKHFNMVIEDLFTKILQKINYISKNIPQLCEEVEAEASYYNLFFMKNSC